MLNIGRINRQSGAVPGNLGSIICFSAAIYHKKDELQEARERKYQELLTQLTVKLSIVNTVNEKLDTIQAVLKEKSDQRIKTALFAIF